MKNSSNRVVIVPPEAVTAEGIRNQGLVRGVYADHRAGGRVIIDDPSSGPVLRTIAELNAHIVLSEAGPLWETPLDRECERLLDAGLVDDTRLVEKKKTDGR